jgi:beta-galactosidase
VLQGFDIAPKGEKEFTVPLPKLPATPGAEYFLNVSFVTKTGDKWAPAGHEISHEQFKLPVSTPAAVPDYSKAPKLDMTEEDDSVLLKGPAFSVLYSKRDGVLTSYKFKGTSILERGPRPDFWRAPTDNDTGARKGTQRAAETNPQLNVGMWRNAGADWAVTSAQVRRESDNSVRIVVHADLPSVQAKATMTYMVYGNGVIAVESSYEPGPAKLAMMPRAGTELIVAPGLENLTWYGQGPVETYVDRGFERVGVYKSTVDKEWVDYSRPQENGNKVDVRWVTLTNAQGIGLRAEGDPLLSVAARHYAKEEIERAAYTFMMQPHPEIFLNLDWKQMGVGGIDSWSSNAWPMQPYRITPDKPYSYRYRLMPVEPAGK